MPAEIFFIPADGVAPLTAARLEAALREASLSPTVTRDGELLWLEFDGFKSRLLTSSGDAPLELITLQLYGDRAREAELTDALEELLESSGYCDGEDFSPDDESA